MPNRARSKLHARIGRRVRALRMEAGITQADLANRIGCSSHFISGIERGVDSPSLNTLEELARAFDTTVAALVAEDEPAGASRLLYDLQRTLRGKDDPRLMRVLRDVAALYEPRRGR